MRERRREKEREDFCINVPNVRKKGGWWSGMIGKMIAFRKWDWFRKWGGFLRDLELFLHLMILEFARFGNRDFLLWLVSRSLWNSLDVFHYVHSIDDFSKDCEMRGKRKKIWESKVAEWKRILKNREKVNSPTCLPSNQEVLTAAGIEKRHEEGADDQNNIRLLLDLQEIGICETLVSMVLTANEELRSISILSSVCLK